MKTLKDYMTEYEKTIAESLAKNPNHNRVITPDLWIYFKFTEDNNITPTSKNFDEVIFSTKDYDTELFEKLKATHKEVMKMVSYS